MHGCSVNSMGLCFQSKDVFIYECLNQEESIPANSTYSRQPRSCKPEPNAEIGSTKRCQPKP